MRKEMKTPTIIATLTALLLAASIASAAPQRTKHTSTSSAASQQATANALMSAKIDTLEATANILDGGQRISEEKFHKLCAMHLRLARELHCYVHSMSGDNYNRFLQITGGFLGGSIVNLNNVSYQVPYDEGLDYEYIDRVYKFNPDIDLPNIPKKVRSIEQQLLQ